MNIGILKKQADGSLFGNLPSLGFKGVSFEPVHVKGNGPNYRASIEGAEIGAAWEKTSAKGNKYLSATLDAPQFVAPVNVAIFEDADDQYRVVWSRDTRETTQD